MPELPEVETMRRGIAPVTGLVIQAIRPLPCRYKSLRVEPAGRELRRRCVGQRIEGVERAGKRVVVRLANQCRLVFEPRMTGLVLLADPPDHSHLRVRVDFDSSAVPHLWFWDRRGLGSVYCWTADEHAHWLASRALGPDALEISARALAERLGTSRRAIKVALLDQRAVAGIGNLYASEILHVARLHPARPCTSLTARGWQRLHEALRTVLGEAIQYEGSTLGDGTYRTALGKPGAYRNHHRVYDREGEVCPTCRKQRVERMVQAQRSTFFCGRCQR